MSRRSTMVLGIVAVLTLFGAPSGQAAPDRPQLVIAHRGASYDNPEHTFFAYDGAVAADADMIECDLQLTADRVLVCMHDTTVDRTTGGTQHGRVDSFTLSQLRSMDFGSWFNAATPARARQEFVGAAVVPFEEQLECYLRLNPRMRFHVETKAPAEYSGAMEPALVDVLRRVDRRLHTRLARGGDPRTSPIVVQSFDLGSLERIRELAPGLPTAYLFSAPADPALLTGGLPAFVDVAAASTLTERFPSSRLPFV